MLKEKKKTPEAGEPVRGITKSARSRETGPPGGGGRLVSLHIQADRLSFRGDFNDAHNCTIICVA